MKSNDTLVLCFARMNPPTIGHMKIERAFLDSANWDVDIRFVVSRSYDSERNPLTNAQKMRYLEISCPSIEFELASPEAPSLMHQVKRAYEEGYKKLHLVCGGDREREYFNLLHKYNGTDYSFEEIRIINAGWRDASNPASGTLMRKAAREGDYETFRHMSPLGSIHTEQMWYDVREGLGLINTPPTEYENEYLRSKEEAS